MPEDGDWIWNYADGYRPLARFASVTALRGLGLLERDAYDKLEADARESGGVREALRMMTARLYDRLRSKRYPYTAPLGYYRDYRRIRDPGAIHQGAGTCLDLSLLFAAMCAGAGLRAFVVILEGHVDGDHAVVLVDLATAPPGVGVPGEGGAGGWEAPVSPEAAADGELGVRRVPPGPGPVTVTARGLAVDVTLACGQAGGQLAEEGGDFAEACDAGAEALTDPGYEKVNCVDVLWCHERDGEAALPARRPVIYPSLPPMPPFTVYESRKEEESELGKAVGTVVILGEPGTGKSMLAHRVASTVDHGSGWFLDASSEQALTVSLATAEALATGQPEQSVDGPELRRLARAARSRLDKADGPWAVVLDNANLAPKDLKSLPQPKPERRQLLIITTTAQEWAESRYQVHTLSGLTPAEVKEGIGATDVPVAALAGRPLFVDVTRRFRAVTGRWWWEGQPAVDLTAARVPDVIWAAAMREIGDGQAKSVARAMRWLPSTRIPVAALAAGPGSADGVRDNVGQLRRLGLVEAEAGDVTMHGLFRSVVRRLALEEGQAAQAALVTRLLGNEAARRVMEFAADLDLAGEMELVLARSADPETALAGLYELATLFERHGGATDSAEWYRVFLERAGWSDGGDVAGDHALRVVNALVGRARAVMRGLSGQRDDPGHLPVVTEAIAWTEEAERLCRERDVLDYKRAGSRAKAMRGILLRKRASLEQDGPAKLGFLRQAEGALRESYEERHHQLENPVTSPDLDRSQFNLAGLEIRLAQSDARDTRTGHLAEALRHYTEVLQTRRQRYRGDEYEEVATCLNGQAIAAYYQAVLLGGTWTERAERLRVAAGHASGAVAIRQGLAGADDDLNTSKSLVLQAKIALARLGVMEAAGIRGDRDEQALKAYQREKSQLLEEQEEASDRGNR